MNFFKLSCIAVLVAIALSASHVQSAEEFVLHSDDTAIGAPRAACQLCINAALALINYVLNAIANGVILKSCSQLCGHLPKGVEQNICNIGCDLVGIGELVKLLNQTDPDPIFYCELVKECPFIDCTGPKCLTIDQMVSEPKSGAQDTTFNVVADYTVHTTLATGMTRVQIHYPEDQKNPKNTPEPIQTDQLNLGFKPGNYSLSVQVPTTPGPPPDPNNPPPPPPFLPGVYTVSVQICEGGCGSKHPHAGTYDEKNTSFTITSGPPGPPGPAPPPGPPSNDYEDPGTSGSCNAGESAIQITGIKGSFCSPSCSPTSPCPTAPAGVSAQPQCVLEKPPSKTPSNCALICKPGAAGQCPSKASCKSIQGTGICTYDA